MISAVVDTNILVSAALARFGNEASLFKAAKAGHLQVCVSEAIWAEYEGVLNRAKFAHVAGEVAAVLATVSGSAKIIRSVRSAFSSLDPDDTCFIDCAMTAGADVLVTGNKRHFPQRFYGSTEVVNARQLLLRLPPVP